MINKGDYFIQILGDKVPAGYYGDSRYGMVFKCTGTQESMIYAEIAGYTSGKPHVEGWQVGKKMTFSANNSVWKYVKANRDTLEAAGITVDKVNTTHDEDLANHVQYRIDRLTKQKDKDYWKFIEDYIQWVKVEAVNNKNAFTMLAAVIESEAKLDKNKDSVIANAATKLLDTMEAIESINKFFYDKVNTK